MAPPLEDPEALWVHELIGALVFDLAGTTLGSVAAIEANPASDLLVLDSAALIPMCFVLGRGDRAGRPSVVVDIPDGLLD
ncbi:MAG: hypothetical protein ACRDX8_03840 [Acidimicrobiales bacterium]